MSTRIAGLCAILLAALAVSRGRCSGNHARHHQKPRPRQMGRPHAFLQQEHGRIHLPSAGLFRRGQGHRQHFNSPTRSPDPQALAKLAARIPESVAQANANIASSMTPGRKIERMSSGATTLRGYPAIVQELRMVGGEKGPVYLVKASIFAKSALVNISSVSPSLELARRNRELFIKAMEVEDTPIQR